MSARWLAAMVLLGTMIIVGCGNEYTCPDPIGEIIRDDCDVYETRYEALAVELGVTFAGFGVGVKAGDEAIRDPSELLQVLRLQTMALCRDYNACRVHPGEYRARRQAMDDKYAAIVALTEQLRTADDTATRRQIVATLSEVIRRPLATPTDEPTPSGQRISPFRDATWMWIGGPHMPPIPKDRPKAIPVLAWWEPIDVGGIGPSSTRIFLTFRGTVAADDFAYAILPDGTESRCAVSLSGPRDYDPERAPQADASCDFDRPAPPTTGWLRVDYRSGLTGERHVLGRVPLDPMDRLKEAWLAYLPSPVRIEPIDHDRPWLVLWLTDRQDRNVTMRCSHEGKPIGGPIRALSSMRRISGLTRYHLPLPISLPRAGGVKELPDDIVAAEAAGAWQCRVSVLGKTARTVAFRLDGTGRPMVPAPSGGVVPPWWAVGEAVEAPAGEQTTKPGVDPGGAETIP